LLIAVVKSQFFRFFGGHHLQSDVLDAMFLCQKLLDLGHQFHPLQRVKFFRLQARAQQPVFGAGLSNVQIIHFHYTRNF